MDEETKQQFAQVDTRLGRVEADVKELKSDVKELKSEMHDARQDIASLQDTCSDLLDGQDELKKSIDDLLLKTTSMTNAMLQALEDLNLSRSYEKRIKRLEDKVFGT